MFVAQTVAVLGVTGQVGVEVAKSLGKSGHRVVGVTRGGEKHETILNELADFLAEVRVVDDVCDVSQLTLALKDVEVVVVCIGGGPEVMQNVQNAVLAAGEAANIRRLVPSEFGIDTKNLSEDELGPIAMKKVFQRRLKASTIPEGTWIFAGGMFDYLLLNFRFYDELVAYGDLDSQFVTHHIKDIGAITAMAAVDPRLANEYLQIDYNSITTRYVLNELKKNYPDRINLNDVKYVDADEIQRRFQSGATTLEKKGDEPEAFRMLLNKLIYVDGRMSTPSDVEILKATEMYPNYEYVRVQDALKDESFVFDA